MEPELNKWLENHNINYEMYNHPPVYTVPQAEKYCGDIPGAHIKNLFLKAEPQNKYYLVTLPGNKRLDIKSLETRLGVEKLYFADEKALKKYLGLTAGAVSPLGLINDKKNQVTFIIDEKIWNSKSVVAHPNINTESLNIPREFFQRIIKAVGNEYFVFSLDFE
ncbi:MAG: Prolyl-tRNA editing protein ProX [Promethearchaeota archaeon]|nr:MAG: Prolyl-tRNA editing protein ProX [Candidatus Lokiarchaeota archaeon]